MTGTESYFENLLQGIDRISLEMRKKLMSLCVPIIGIHKIGEKKTENNMPSSEFSGKYYF